MGFSFKENCPDIRNTKVIDIIRELENYGLNYEIVDPWVDKEEAKRLYALNIKSKINFKVPYQGIICTVAHNQFTELSINQWKSLIVEKGIIFDVKGFLPRELKAERM